MSDLPYRPNVGVMLTQGGRVWVGERLDTPGAWQMPQGGVDPGEDARAAALRELAEETGVSDALVEVVAELPEPVRYDLPPDVAARLWKGRYRGQEQRWFLMRFLGADGDVVIDQPHPEFSAWKWVQPAEMLGLIVPFKRQVYETVIAGFAGRL